jgi:hypothetical protein
MKSSNKKRKRFRIKSGELKGYEYEVEGWWKEITGKSWMFSDGNIACIQYAVRSSKDELPIDDNVYYGHIGGLGYLVHMSELGEEIVEDEHS